MRGIEELLKQMKNIDRSDNAKEETLRNLQKNRKRKSRPFFPIVITGVVLVALFFIMMNFTDEVSPEQAQGIALEEIKKSSLMRSVSFEEFNPELVNHVGVVDIYDNEEWESTVRKVLQTMNETEILSDDMSLYDLGISSNGQHHRFKIWQLDERILIQDFDSDTFYVNDGNDTEKLLKMANEFIEKLTAPSLGFTKEEFKKDFNQRIADRLKIRIGEMNEDTKKNEVHFKLLIKIENEVDWEVVELTGLKSPVTNELTQIKFSENNAGVKEPGHDRLHWYQFAVTMKEMFNFNRSEEEFIQMTGMFVDDRSVDYEVAISSPEVIFYVKLEGDELSMVIEPAIPK